MWYRGSVTVPADTARADYVSAEVEACPGTVEFFYRLFPAGCAGLVYLQVFHQTRQIFPTSPGQSYIGDDSEVLGHASVVLSEAPYMLELRAWSPGTDYDHTVYCEFYVKQQFVMMPVALEFAALPGVS